MTFFQTKAKGGRLAVGNLSVLKSKSGYTGGGGLLIKSDDSDASILPMPYFNGSGLLVTNGWENNCSDPVMVTDYQGNLVELQAGALVYEGARYVDTGGGVYDIYNTDTEGALLDPAPVLTHVPGSTNVFLNSTTPATQSITLGTGDWTLSVYGSGSVTSSAGTATGTGYGVATEGSDNTINITGSGTVTFTVSGSLDYVQVENKAFSTPPIETAGAAVSRNATAYRQALVQNAQWDTGDGVELWLTPALDPAWTDNGDGSYDLVGNGSYQPMTETEGIASGDTYLVEWTCDELSGGSMKVQSAGAVFTFASTGQYSEVLTATANLLGFARNAGSVNCKISNISVQKVQRNFTTFKQSAGTLIFDWVPEYDINAVNDPSGLLSIAESLHNVLYHNFNGVMSHHGVGGTGELAVNSNGSDKYRAAVRWSDADSEMQVGIKNITTDSAWSWTAAATYDGEFNAGSYINLFYSNDYINQLHDIKLFGKALTTGQIEAKYS